MNDTHCKISAATLARTAALALALTNQVLSACGKPMLPIESATVEQLVTTGLTVTAALVNWWKNNSFTPEAIKADGYLEQPFPTKNSSGSCRRSIHFSILNTDAPP